MIILKREVKMIIRQFKEYDISNVVSRIHNEEDFIEGDLAERLEEYKYYNHISGYFVAALNTHSYDIDEDKVEEIIEEIKENGLKNMPKIVIDEYGDIIDGVHRAAALAKMEITTIDVLKGTNAEYISEFKKELIDEELNIYRISNELGFIDIMENAKYSPAENSISQFVVKEDFRSLGVGTELLKEAFNQYKDLGAQVSSLASLKSFIKLGFTFKGNENIKECLEYLEYGFGVFQKTPRLLNNKNSGIYKDKIVNFNETFETAKLKFNENGGSLFLRRNEVSEKKSKLKMKR
jgi:GNAT superfamily N-acetyltransferase